MCRKVIGLRHVELMDQPSCREDCSASSTPRTLLPLGATQRGFFTLNERQ
jgi:hypothetical protein